MSIHPCRRHVGLFERELPILFIERKREGEREKRRKRCNKSYC
jgi:hypothetical protein